MSLAPRVSLLVLFILSACAAPMQQNASPPATEAKSSLSKLDSLVDASTRLRAQYEAMGETLKWQEAEIAALRQTANPAPVRITPEATPSDTTKKAPPAEVGSLTEQDLQPIHLVPKTTDAKADSATQEATAFYVHVASFADQASAAKGWKQFKAKNSRLFGKVSGVTTSFTDKNNKQWQRVWAGPYATALDAKTSCATLKKKGSWCEVLPLADTLTTKLP